MLNHQDFGGDLWEPAVPLATTASEQEKEEKKGEDGGCGHRAEAEGRAEGGYRLA